jgi:hypothetical protein
MIRGTSLYAKQAATARLATIIHTVGGWFFIMPNPKYHRELSDRKGLLSKDAGKFRFVAWWIHPRFVPELRRWFERITFERREQERQEKEKRAAERAKAEKAEKADHEKDHGRKREFGDTEAGGGARGADVSELGVKGGDDPPSPKFQDKDTMPPPAPQRERKDRALSPSGATSATAPYTGAEGEDSRAEKKARCAERKDDILSGKDFPMGMGGPGDFCFSDVPKPENYLHTYRDLHTREHTNMLNQLCEGVNRFLRTLFDENFLSSAQISAGFHYPVRPQYSTLHMQLRVNSGSVCRDDGRGIDVHSLIECLQGDRLRYQRDSEPVRYQVTENIKVSLLAAAKKYTEVHPEMEVVRQTAPLGYDLGILNMNVKLDDGQLPQESEAEKQEVVGEYIINLQPSPGTPFYDYLYAKRAECAEAFGKDPSHLYPIHISVTGFFESSKAVRDSLVNMIQEVLTEELSELKGESAVKVKDCLSVNVGYVIWDVDAIAITAFAKTLSLRAKDLGLNIRAKAVNHISLAMGRPDPEQRRQIEDIYAAVHDKVKRRAEFDIVLSRRVFRASFDRLEVDGPHGFKEVARVPCTTRPGGPGSPSLSYQPSCPLPPEI